MSELDELAAAANAPPRPIRKRKSAAEANRLSPEVRAAIALLPEYPEYKYLYWVCRLLSIAGVLLIMFGLFVALLSLDKIFFDASVIQFLVTGIGISVSGAVLLCIAEVGSAIRDIAINSFKR